MYRQVHANRVFRKTEPKAANRYRQVAVVEKDQFEVRIFEGDVIQTDSEFVADCSNAEVHTHPTLQEALADAEMECEDSVERGWEPV